MFDILYSSYRYTWRSQGDGNVICKETIKPRHPVHSDEKMELEHQNTRHGARSRVSTNEGPRVNVEAAESARF